MRYLVHYEIAVLEVAEQSVVDFDADVVLVLLQAEAAEEEIFHPVVIEFRYDGFLRKVGSTMSSLWIILPSSSQHDQKQGKALSTSMKILRASSNLSCYLRIRP